MEKNTVTSSPDAAATDAIIAAICSFSRVPETQTMLIFWDITTSPYARSVSFTRTKCRIRGALESVDQPPRPHAIERSPDLARPTTQGFGTARCRSESSRHGLASPAQLLRGPPIPPWYIRSSGPLFFRDYELERVVAKGELRDQKPQTPILVLQLL